MQKEGYDFKFYPHVCNTCGGKCCKNLNIEGKTSVLRFDNGMVLVIEKGDCPFLTSGRCSIYEDRPFRCKTFPFWKDVDVELLKKMCPGVVENDGKKRRV